MSKKWSPKWQGRVRRVLEYLAQRDRNGVIGRWKMWLVTCGYLDWSTMDELLMLRDRVVAKFSPHRAGYFIVGTEAWGLIEEMPECDPGAINRFLGVDVLVDRNLEPRAVFRVRF